MCTSVFNYNVEYYTCLFSWNVYIYWCPTRFPYHMMFVSFNSNTMDVISGAGMCIIPENLSSPPVFCWVRVAQINSALCSVL